MLPPVEWALQVPPPAKPVARASAMARLAERPRRKSPLLVAGGASFLLTSAIIAVVVLVQHPDPPPQPVPAAVSAVASASATASAPPSVAEPAPAPSSTIPVLSPGELPLVQGRPPGATPAPQSQPRSHPRLSFSPPPQAAADTPALGQLTVVCTPACDEVFDGARSLGPSPVFKAPVSAGVHRLRLHLDDGPTDKVVTVTVTGGDTAVVREAVGK